MAMLGLSVIFNASDTITRQRGVVNVMNVMNVPNSKRCHATMAKPRGIIALYSHRRYCSTNDEMINSASGRIHMKCMRPSADSETNQQRHRRPERTLCAHCYHRIALEKNMQNA